MRPPKANAAYLANAVTAVVTGRVIASKETTPIGWLLEVTPGL